jgi:hypothetical protein
MTGMINRNDTEKSGDSLVICYLLTSWQNSGHGPLGVIRYRAVLDNMIVVKNVILAVNIMPSGWCEMESNSVGCVKTSLVYY